MRKKKSEGAPSPVGTAVEMTLPFSVMGPGSNTENRGGARRGVAGRGDLTEELARVPPQTSGGKSADIVSMGRRVHLVHTDTTLSRFTGSIAESRYM